jgi:hypothetical protein
MTPSHRVLTQRAPGRPAMMLLDVVAAYGVS